MGLNGHNSFLLDFIGMSLSFTGSYWVLLVLTGFSGLFWNPVGLRRVLFLFLNKKKRNEKKTTTNPTPEHGATGGQSTAAAWPWPICK